MSDANSGPARAIGGGLDIPADRRALAEAHAAALAQSAARVALMLEFHASTEDFRRVLLQEARP
jgi:hypothetical protein